jgi:hypothetical protein
VPRSAKLAEDATAETPAAGAAAPMAGAAAPAADAKKAEAPKKEEKKKVIHFFPIQKIPFGNSQDGIFLFI